ncbi:hypothetical protein BD310DRAFT_730663 [Dichomitus squalens]|uniref:Uncharacterized protein n=1 Tax=Dichomitus squalens TaxID=114155 RepID=A0A4Q9PKR6_9APHY|nr:hypothetical protein BD310DRAFT_730663 [Dichomitus squalens]
MATMSKVPDEHENSSLLTKLHELVCPLRAIRHIPKTYKIYSDSRCFLTFFVVLVAFLLPMNDLGELVGG